MGWMIFFSPHTLNISLHSLPASMVFEKSVGKCNFPLASFRIFNLSYIFFSLNIIFLGVVFVHLTCLLFSELSGTLSKINQPTLTHNY